MTLDYDMSVFEEITDENIQLMDSWGGLTYNKENGKMIIQKVSSTKNSETLLKINLKSKQDIKAEETQISIKDIDYSGADKVAKDAVLTIKTGKTINTVLVIIIAIVGLVLGTAIGYILVRHKKGEIKNDT